MSTRPPRHQPRHLAGAPAAERAPRPVEPETLDGVELLEVTPMARAHRSRIAFAVSITLAALPLLVLDNMPATAGTDQSSVEVETTAAEQEAPSLLDITSTTAAPSTTSTEAPATSGTEAPAATSGTEAPASTEAPAVQPLVAPAPTVAPEPPPAPRPPSPPTTSAPAPAPAPTAKPGDPADPATWDRLAQCESHGRWDLDTGNGYYGGLQFSLATWRDVGGSGYPHQASRTEQVRRGQILQARYGWGQWPHCSSALGYR